MLTPVTPQTLQVDKWVLGCARDMAKELEVPIGAMLMDPQYVGIIARTTWHNPRVSTRVDLMAFARPFWVVNYGNDDLLTDIVLHEMAHAMLPYNAGHASEWQTLAQSLGSRGEQFCKYPRNEPQNLRWKGRCYKCGFTISVDHDNSDNVYVCPVDNCTGKYRMVDTQSV